MKIVMKKILVLLFLYSTILSAYGSNACITDNNESAGNCEEWFTGIQSENKFLSMGGFSYNYLTSTDQGWPVLNADGTDLVLMVFGDTFSNHHDNYYDPYDKDDIDYINLNSDIRYEDCLENNGGGIIPEKFTTYDEKDLFCKYYASDPAHQYNSYFTLAAPSDYVDPLPNSYYNTKTDIHGVGYHSAIFFNAQKDSTSKFGIKLIQRDKWTDTLSDKETKNLGFNLPDDYRAIFRNDDEILKNKPIGTYTIDYFYATAKDTTKPKVLFFLTETICWQFENSANKCTDDEKNKINGVGIYNYNTNRRLEFSDDKQRELNGTPNFQFNTIKNRNIVWGEGSKFRNPIVIRDMVDKYSTSQTKYIYLRGYGEYLNKLNPVYIARIPADEKSVREMKVEYFTGIVNSKSTWTTVYNKAKPVYYQTAPTSSIIKKDNIYWAISTGLSNDFKNQGAIIMASPDGFNWGDPEFAAYSIATPAPGMIYGHYFIPPVVFESNPNNKGTYLAYIFSVWKNYESYRYDYFFDYNDKNPIDGKNLFRDYNTKIYKYNYESKKTSRQSIIINDQYFKSNQTLTVDFYAFSNKGTPKSNIVAQYCECASTDKTTIECKENTCKEDTYIPETSWTNNKKWKTLFADIKSATFNNDSNIGKKYSQNVPISKFSTSKIIIRISFYNSSFLKTIELNFNNSIYSYPLLTPIDLRPYLYKTTEMITVK